MPIILIYKILANLYIYRSMYGIDMNNPSMAELEAFNGHVAIIGLFEDGYLLNSIFQR